MKVTSLNFKQCSQIINNDFASSVGQSNDKYVNYKDEILKHYYNLLEKRNQKDLQERTKITKYGTDYRGYRVVVIKTEEGYFFDIYRSNRKTLLFKWLNVHHIPIDKLSSVVYAIDSVIDNFQGKQNER
jgi:hypothetical protein